MDRIAVHAVGAATRERLVSATACPALRRQGLRLCGTSEALPGFRFVRPGGLAQVLACTGGEGAVWTADAWRRLGPGQAYLTAEGEPHAYQADRPRPWLLAWAILDAGAWRGRPALIPCDADGLRAAIEGLCRAAARGGDPPVVAAWAGTVAAQARAVCASAGDPVLEGLWTLVDAEPDAPWSLARLSARSGLHPEALRRRCQKALGRGPMHQVAEIRLRVAASLLAGGSRSVKEVAFRVGYADQYAFSSAFRRRFGLPPSAVKGRGG